MDRRHFLALAGASSGLVTGCLGIIPDGESKESGDVQRMSMGESATLGGTQLTVANPRIKKAIAPAGGVHRYVEAHAGQFLVVDLRIDGEAPDSIEHLDIKASIDGERVAIDDALRGQSPAPLLGSSPSYVFPVPTRRAEQVGIRWAVDGSSVLWEAPQSVRENLAVEPAYNIEELAVPRRDGRYVLEMSVVNKGDRDGQFLAEVSQESFSGARIVQSAVPAEESSRVVGSPGPSVEVGTTVTVSYPGPREMTSIRTTVESSGSLPLS